jgi:hypothetical protein
LEKVYTCLYLYASARLNRQQKGMKWSSFLKDWYFIKPNGFTHLFHSWKFCNFISFLWFLNY